VEIKREIVEQGARLYGVDSRALQPLGGMDGVVYGGRQGGRGFVLKFVPVAAPDLPVVQERWAFAAYLAQNGVRVARPEPSLAGNLIEFLPDGDAPAGTERQWAVTRAVRAVGRHPDFRGDASRKDALIEVWGRTLGRMHALSLSYEGGAALPGALDECDSFIVWCARACHDPEMDARWRALRGWMETLPQEHEVYGVVHNDFHTQNMLVTYPGGRPSLTVIDFDVCVRHWYAADIAVSLFPATWDWIPVPAGMERPAFVRHFWERFAAGYQRENPLDPEWVALLPQFLRAHQMLLYVVFTDEWRGGNLWQQGLLARWRREIVEDAPVVDITFSL
jgi:Ser/Thr protein kinase RdoA (MazF antagonist)